MPLSAAALVVYYNLMDKPARAADGAELAQRLDAIAGALGEVAPIYTRDEGTGIARQLTRVELIFAGLSAGSASADHRAKLHIRKSDLLQAIAVLREAHHPV